MPDVFQAAKTWIADQVRNDERREFRLSLNQTYPRLNHHTQEEVILNHDSGSPGRMQDFCKNLGLCDKIAGQARNDEGS